MNNHKSIKKETITGLGLGVLILIAFNLVVVNALSVTPLPSQPTLIVKQLPAQPELTVQQGRSVFYEDGSIDLQPASQSAKRTLQTTVEANFLQGN